MLLGRQVKLPRSKWEKIEKLAEKEGMSVNAMVNELLTEALLLRELRVHRLVGRLIESFEAQE